MTLPMGVAFPQEAAVRSCETEYMFCGELLVSPVLQENARTQTVSFPAGVWYGLFDDSVQAGGQTREIPVTWEYSPVYLRAGTAIPVSVRTDGAAADAVHRAGGGKWIGVCGELAADASLTAKFLAAGADELSVSPPYIAEIKEKIRSSV